MRIRTVGGTMGVAVLVAVASGCFRGGERADGPAEPSPQAAEGAPAAAPGSAAGAAAVDGPASPAPAIEPGAVVAREPGPPAKADGATRLKGGARSELELATWVLQALKEKDARKLHLLRVDSVEFIEHVFPETPEAQGKVKAEFQWDWLNVHSFKGIDEAIRKYGGLDLELIEVIPTEGIKEYPTCKFWSYCELLVRFPDGEERQIKVFGSLVEMDGTFKILGFPT